VKVDPQLSSTNLFYAEESPIKPMISINIDCFNEPRILDFSEIETPHIAKIKRELPAKYVHNFIRVGNVAPEREILLENTYERYKHYLESQGVPLVKSVMTKDSHTKDSWTIILVVEGESE